MTERDKNSKALLKRFWALNLSIREAARRLGIPRSTFYTFLTTGHLPDSPEWQNFADVFEAWVDAQEAEAGVVTRQGIQETATMPLTQIALSQEVLTHWGLARDPFSQEMADYADILELSPFQKAERKILRAVQTGGWVAIAGPVGSGKTTLVRKVTDKLHKRGDVYLVEPAAIEIKYLNPSQICDSILLHLAPGEKIPNGLIRKSRKVGEYLLAAHKDHQKVVLLIDEAHLLSQDALLALKRFHEMQAEFEKLLSIILVGQLLLAKQLRLNLQVMEVGQRVDLFELGQMNGATGQYLAHKLERAGHPKGAEVFDKKAIRAISKRADTPLAINNLSAASLVAAYELAEEKVTAEIVSAVHREG